MLFTDGSVHPPSRTGYGAYLAVTDPAADPETLKDRIQLKRFKLTSSTQLEIQTLLWALGEIQAPAVTVYTDSQNMVGLPGRRERFELHEYRSKSGARHRHADLYQEFYRLTDQFGCTFVKVKGHHLSDQKDAVDRFFTLVDRASRQALRTDPLCI
ncbi:ribonuclease HI [Pontiella sulfatireligans]|nr:RNase H family protein [Pontiella sulfatireligans]